MRRYELRSERAQSARILTDHRITPVTRLPGVAVGGGEEYLAVRSGLL